MAAVIHSYIQSADVKFRSPSPKDKAFQRSACTADLSNALHSYRKSRQQSAQPANNFSSDKKSLPMNNKEGLQIEQYTHNSGTMVLTAEPLAYWAGRYNSTRDRLCAVDPEISERTRDIYIFAELRRTCLTRPAKISFLAFETTFKSMIAKGVFFTQGKEDAKGSVQEE